MANVKSRPSRINFSDISRNSKRRTRMTAMKFQHHQLLFFASLFFVTYSEAFAATTFSSTKKVQSSAVSSIKRGGSLFSTTNIDDEESLKQNVSSKSRISYAKGFGTTLLRSYNSNGLNGDHGDVKNVVEAPEQEKIITCRYVADTKLPTDLGNFRLRAYRVDGMEHDTYVKNEFVGKEPCVIYHADKPPFGAAGMTNVDVPVRIHDQCFTSEVFGSKRCDCKEQLKKTLLYIKENGGALIYLQQEGRGIGIANKVAAYALQDQGLDTVDANVHLGFPEDARQYGVVPSILEDLGIDSIQLITNNPRKVEKMESLGVEVSGTIPMVVKTNAYNRKYIQAKHERMRHQNFGEMLSLDKQKQESVSDLVSDTMFALRCGQSDNGVAQCINDNDEKTETKGIHKSSVQGKSKLQEKDYPMEGVTASENGYCFGRKSVEDAIAAVARGEIVVVVDDMDRENEGDFIMAADMATPETIATIIRYSSGVICIGMEGSRMDELKLPAMLKTNEDPKGTAFSVTVDATKEHGITTGISATERAITLKLLANSSSIATDFARPGHIFPLRAKEGGVLTRDGHTEAAVDLSKLAGRHPSGVLCEIVSEENPVEMARLPELRRFCEKHGFVLTSIVDIAQYRRDTEQDSEQ